MDELPDIRYHRTDVIFGIHRKVTIEAVNELYDRAHCDPKDTATAGGRAFKQLPNAVVVPDDRADATDAPRTPTNVGDLPTRSTTIYVPRKAYTVDSQRHTVTVTTNDEPAAPCPRSTHPNEIYYGPIRGCPNYVRLPN